MTPDDKPSLPPTTDRADMDAERRRRFEWSDDDLGHLEIVKSEKIAPNPPPKAG